MVKLSQFAISVFLLSAAAGAGAQPASDVTDASAKPKDHYVRLLTNEYGAAVSLQTEIIGFEGTGPGGDKLRVDLVGAVHIADAAYYAELNERFKAYDTVLYEIVAPEGTKIPRGGVEPKGLISNAQVGMTKLLGLTFQLQQIDYTARNFVHADFTPQEMEESMNERGESFLQYFMKLFAASMSEQAQESAQGQGAGLLYALFSQDRERLFKIQFAVSMADMDMLDTVLDGDEGSTLLTERNKRVIEVLKRQIAKGDRHIAIFYGAGHLQDLSERLENELGFKRVDSVWLDAWNLR